MGNAKEKNDKFTRKHDKFIREKTQNYDTNW